MKQFYIIVILLAATITTYAQSNNRITYNEQEIFLNGTNLAWIDFANDIGNNDINFSEFGAAFKAIHDYGGNSVRLWLHTNGTKTPEFSNDTVVSPGTGAIDDLIEILDSAYKYDVGVILSLWSFDMLRQEIGEPYLSRNHKILEEDAALNSYIEYALKPMVDSTKNHPGIIAWEVFNEPEGMIAGITDGSWSGIDHVSTTDIQRVINRVAGAIHSIDSNLQVTSGANTLASLSDSKGDKNIYSDAELYNAGGDSLGYLNFYEVHFYSSALNPFQRNYSYWELDKPLIIGEFHPGATNVGDFSNYENLLNNDYAGAMGWMWFDEYQNEIKDEIQYMLFNQTDAVDIDNNIGDTPSLDFTGPNYGTTYEEGSNIEFSAAADDSDGSISRVDFISYNEIGTDSILFSDTEAPYEYTWANANIGTYYIYGKAVDNDGYSMSSNRIQVIVGNPANYRYEAEEGTLSGSATVYSDANASNREYVYFEDNCTITWTIPNCPADGTYDMVICYELCCGEKNQYIVINNDNSSRIDWAFTGNADTWLRDTISINLVEGENTISIVKFWGWMNFDYIDLPFARISETESITLSSSTGENSINEKGGSLQMVATFYPEDAAFFSPTWAVNNTELATIDENGLLTATGAKDGTITVTATATDGTGVSGNMEISLNNQTTGVDLNSLSKTKFYPNPVTDILNFKLEKVATKIEIYNVQGSLIQTSYPNTAKGSINVSEFKAGVYYINTTLNDNNQKIDFFIKAE